MRVAKSRHYKLYNEDNLKVLRSMPDNCIDSIVTDPPYGMSKEPDVYEMIKGWYKHGHYDHVSKKGFMGKEWDAFVPQPLFWKEAMRVLKPGGYVVSFFSNRTYDIGVLAIRMAGFEIRDQIDWLYGQGFPKSQNVSKALDVHHGKSRKVVGRRKHPTLKDSSKINRQGKQQFHGKNSIKDEWDVTESASSDAKQWEGWGTALKSAKEPIVLARKPLIGTMAVNILEHGTGGINIDASRIPTSKVSSRKHKGKVYDDVHEGYKRKNKSSYTHKTDWSTHTNGKFPTNVILTHDYRCTKDACYSECPVHNIDLQKNDVGFSSNFFYCAKPSKKEKDAGLDHFKQVSAGERVNRKEGTKGINNPRAGAGRTSAGTNIHPTVKPIALMEYLVRLVTPRNGIILDPFMGSGTTGIAAYQVQCKFIGIEMELSSARIAKARIDHWSTQEQEQKEPVVKKRRKKKKKRSRNGVGLLG